MQRHTQNAQPNTSLLEFGRPVAWRVENAKPKELGGDGHVIAMPPLYDAVPR